MIRCRIPLVWLLLYLLNLSQAQSSNDGMFECPTITITESDVDDKVLKLRYEIKNASQQDIWICESGFEIYLDEDGQTLLIRKRLDVPSAAQYHVQPWCRFTRLYPGEKRVESLTLPLPVHPVYGYKSRERLQRTVDAPRLSIDIGYYLGDLPDLSARMVDEAENSPDPLSDLIKAYFEGPVGFNRRNEALTQRSEKIRIPYTHQRFGGEKILGTTIDDLSIPYRDSGRPEKPNPPHLTNCTRVEIEFEPSMLDYFYPYQSQRGLLNGEELRRLGLEKTLLLENAENINDFAQEVKQAEQYLHGIDLEKGRANVSCYKDNMRVCYFVTYDDISIMTEHKQLFIYDSGLQSLRKFTPAIQPFELRMQCANNLRHLWHRLRLYDSARKARIHSYSFIGSGGPGRPYGPNKSESENIRDESKRAFESLKTRHGQLDARMKSLYPSPRPRGWCDSMEWAFVGPSLRSRRHEVASKMKVHVCPSISDGLSTYAMNPNCKDNSPPDMVLLFDTRDGWNQHGGPELSTFDNHDPKGGCVLLKDGTVKFIRTEEELQRLRWK